MAEVDAVVPGVRAAHQVDVLVSPDPEGSPARRWLVECKDQRRRVGKSAVLTFRGVLDDTGAERGFLVAEAPFQPGAMNAASRTNVTLCTLRGLREELAEVRNARLLQHIERRAVAARDQLRSLFDRTVFPSSLQYGDVFDSALNWMQWEHWVLVMTVLLEGLIRARANAWPAVVVKAPPEHTFLGAQTLLVADSDSFTEAAEANLAAAEDWLAAAERWLSPGRNPSEHERVALQDRMQRAFEGATWKPPSGPAGPTRHEERAIDRLFRSARVKIGYHAAKTPTGMSWVAIDESLFFVLDDVATVCFAAVRWLGAPRLDSQRLVLEETKGEVSGIDATRGVFARPTRVGFFRDASDVETAARVEFADGAALYVWITDTGRVEFSSTDFQGSDTLRPSREYRRPDPPADGRRTGQ